MAIACFDPMLHAGKSFWDGPDAYLGQSRPSDTPKIVAPGLLADPGTIVMDRIGFSLEGKEIYCLQNDRWYRDGPLLPCFSTSLSACITSGQQKVGSIMSTVIPTQGDKKSGITFSFSTVNVSPSGATIKRVGVPLNEPGYRNRQISSFSALSRVAPSRSNSLIATSRHALKMAARERSTLLQR